MHRRLAFARSRMAARRSMTVSNRQHRAARVTHKPKKTEHDEFLKPAKDASKVLSKRTRLLNTSEFKRQVFYALENIRQGKTPARIAGCFLFFLILANAVVVFFSVQPDLEPLTTNILRAFYVFSTLCFFLEYLSRIWIADLAFGNCTRARARLKYIFSPMGIIDFLSFVPSMVSWFLPVTPAIIHSVNVLRLIRLVKVTRYMRGFRTMSRVLSKHYQEIIASFLVILIVTVVTCVVMYEVEHEAQPHVFTDLFQSFWYAVQTVTSTGYGDIVPITPIGKVCGMIVMLLALGLVAIPGGIFSAGFVAEFQYANMRKIERDVERNNPRSNKTNNTHESSSSNDASESDDAHGTSESSNAHSPNTSNNPYEPNEAHGSDDSRKANGPSDSPSNRRTSNDKAES